MRREKRGGRGKGMTGGAEFTECAKEETEESGIGRREKWAVTEPEKLWTLCEYGDGKG